MGNDQEKEFFEQFEDSSDKGKSLNPLDELFDPDVEEDEFAELGELILRYQDGAINRKQVTRMQDWLLGDDRAMKYYIDYAYLCAGLTMLLSKKRVNSFLDRILAINK